MATKTLAQEVKPASIDWETLHKNYNPLLNLVKELLGIIPNCDPLLEIWQPGFRTYNLLVPNMFNLPNTLLGSRSFKAAMGLAMYASSKAACAYCTAHACSFALRRGLRTEAIAGSRTEKEQAVVTLAENLSHIPATVTLADVEAVRKHFSASETGWLVYAISMMGFLNKFMNVMGVELEQEAMNDTAELLARTGWDPGIHAANGYNHTAQTAIQRDNIFTYLRVIKQAPGAVRWEKKWTRGVPATYPEAASYLEKQTGYSFPILAPVTEPRVLRTLAAVLRDNLDNGLTVTGLKIKMDAGYIFSAVVANRMLKTEMQNLAARIAPSRDDDKWARLDQMAKTDIPADRAACKEFMTGLQQQQAVNEKEAAAILLAIAASHSPAAITDAVRETVVEHMEPAAIVEIVVWLAVLQLLNRLSSFYRLGKEN